MTGERPLFSLRVMACVLPLLFPLAACDTNAKAPETAPAGNTAPPAAAQAPAVAQGALAPDSAPASDAIADTAGGAAVEQTTQQPPAEAAATVKSFADAWAAQDIGSLEKTLSQRCQSPQVSNRAELLTTIWRLFKDGISLAMNPETLQGEPGYPMTCAGELRNAGGQVEAYLTLVLLEEAEGWQIVEVNIGQQMDELPDVIDPNGAFVPVQGSQF